MSFTESKFHTLPLRKQHKHAGKHLRTLFEQGTPLDETYRSMEKWLNLPPIDGTQEALVDRFHLHMKEASLAFQEHNLLLKQCDQLSTTPFLPIHIYLEDLRSAFNIGNILRTVEAFRLGTVIFSENSPTATHPKVIKTAMGTHLTVPSKTASLETLPRPWIALETVPSAPSLFEFEFPQTFSLILGNEERGLKEETQKKADTLLNIPLVGSKNSLNVASCFSIAAAFINKQLRHG